MQYVIALITSIAGLLIAVHRLQQAGVDLNALNPFVWWRRKQLAKLYGQKPLYVLDQPMEAAALLMLATAKCEGEVSREQKRFLVQSFEDEFHLSVRDASALLSQSAYLLRDEKEIASQLNKILERSLTAFTREQIESTLKLMEHVSTLEDLPNERQVKLIGAARRIFKAQQAQPNKWQ